VITGLAALWAAERGGGLARLAGSRIHAFIPIRERLIDHLIARLPVPTAVKGLHVRALPGSRLQAIAEIRVLGFRKRIEVILGVALQGGRDAPRRILLSFADPSFVTKAIGIVAPLAAKLPAFVSIDAHGAAIDLDRLAAAAGALDLWHHVNQITLETHGEGLWARIDIEIDPAAPATPTAARAPGAPRTPTIDGAPDLVALLAGAHLAFRLRVEESLVNDLLDAGLGHHLPSATTPLWTCPSPSLGFSPPRVRFEPRLLILESDLTIGESAG
jgi:hypothetical protein